MHVDVHMQKSLFSIAVVVVIKYVSLSLFGHMFTVKLMWRYMFHVGNVNVRTSSDHDYLIQDNVS